MADTQSRLERRIRRDFPEPGSAHGVLQLLAGLPRTAGYDERVQAAIVLLADRDIGRLHRALDLAAKDWRDLLVAAGLADEDWPDKLDRELGPDTATTVLWRPTGPEELELVRQSGWRAWPPRLPGQPIFYPVLNEDYAIKIARDWNVPASGAGYVTRFRVRSAFLARYPVHQAGGSTILELWIPAEDLDDLNANIVGQIEVTRVFTKDSETTTTQGFTADEGRAGPLEAEP
jgi:hypothetical protein